MSFLAEDGKSNCVCSAVLAEQPNQVQSFGLGEKISFLQHGLSEELPCAPSSTPCLPFAVCRSLRDVGSIYSRPAAVGWKFFGGLCTHGGKQRAECCTLPRALYEAGNCLVE